MIKENTSKDGFIVPMRILKPGECRNCGHPINVLMIESYILQLGPNGIPIKHIPVQLRSIGHCPKCNTFVNAELIDGFTYSANSKPVKGYSIIKNNYNPVDPDCNPFIKKEISDQSDYQISLVDH